jgi:hypothetical protein
MGTPRAVERTDPPYLTRSIPYFEVKSMQFSVITVLRLVCRRILLDKLTVPEHVKIFMAIYGTRSFITAFTRARNMSLSSARLIQSTLS